MKKYKLNTDLFRGFGIGAEIIPYNRGEQYALEGTPAGGNCIPKEMIDAFPSYFEEVKEVKKVSELNVKEEPNYLITAFRFKDSLDIWDLKSDGCYGANPIISKYTLEEMLNGRISVSDNSVEIYSVKNSKGEEFTIGDKTNYGAILTFKTNVNGDNTRMYVAGTRKSYNTDLNNLIKVKEPLYTTTDDVEIMEGDRVWLSLLHKDLSLHKNDLVLIGNFSKQDKEVADRYLTFTSEENRDKYIKENSKKPIFVSADRKEMYEGDTVWHLQNETDFNISVSSVRKNNIYGDIRFSTEEAAKEYIDFNKPKYSLANIENCYPHANITGNRIKDIPVVATLFSNLKKLGK